MGRKPHFGYSMDCAFCTSTDVKDRLIATTDLSQAFPTNTPIVPGHILVTPRRCTSFFEDLSREERDDLFMLVRRVKEGLKKFVAAEGFHIVWNDGAVAGQSVPHLHIHVIPRKAGDTGITQYDPRQFIYRPGPRLVSPIKELIDVARGVKETMK